MRSPADTGRRVIVVGAGGAGLAAGLEAARAGARVLLLEAGDQVGGATARAGGVVYAADTPVQKARGIEDSVDRLVNYYATVSRHELEPRLMRRSAEGTREVIGWLEELGISWEPERLYVAGLEFDPRGHLPSGDTRGLGPAGGAMIVAALLTAVEERPEVEIRTRTRVADLLVEDGRVAGVRLADGTEERADAVVLASGGFGAGAEMLAAHWPEATRHGDWHWYLGPDTNVGDGLRMGLAAGAELRGYGGTLLETPNFGRLNDAFTPPWLIYVNQRGHRFVDETDTYCVMPHVIARQPGGVCWAVFDDAALRKVADGGHVDPYGLGVDLESNWTGAMLRRQIDAGVVRTGATLAELAEGTGIAADGLAATVELWNADVAAGRDSVFDKSGELVAVESGPFYAVELRPAIIGITFGGLRIDDAARVLDTAGRPIPGLHAAGEVAGGLDADVYAGGGTSIGNALVFGRVAARTAVGVAAPA
ncbi:FAD-dependent oxidoreductase [Nocardioides humi]|uniref:Flavocytochrome c n=1 Tax=Nocardioides humi TaxID=449461 RepID=A0ABN2AHD3_9ACTN|nr:FAD-dependent oxidoreductase [Nocardioides humi]